MKKFQYNSPVILSFFLISLLTLGLDWLSNGWTTGALFSVYRSSFADPLTYLRMVLHVLGHADWQHYIGNMLMLLVIGPPMEERYGGGALALSIAATALVSALAQWLLFPDTALLGASGIVFMLIVMASLSGMRRGELPLTLLLVLVLYLGQEVLAGLFTRDNISQLTHIIGGLMGAVLGFALRRA